MPISECCEAQLAEESAALGVITPFAALLCKPAIYVGVRAHAWSKRGQNGLRRKT